MKKDIFELCQQKFSQREFYSHEKFDNYIKEMDAWWAKRHDLYETEEEYQFRIKYFNRPKVGGIINV